MTYRHRFPLTGAWMCGMAELPGLELFRQAGIVGIRLDLLWSTVEPTTKGVYDFTRADQVMGMLESKGLRCWITFNGGNPLYGGIPKTATQLTAWKRYVRALVTRFKGRGVVWEVWNEPDLIEYWDPVDAVAYAKLAQETVRTIRDVSKDEWIVAGGVATVGRTWNDPEPNGFLLRAVELGLPVDCLVPHGYRHSAPETIIYEMMALERECRKRGFSGAFGIGEWGYEAGYLNNPPYLEARRADAYGAMTTLAKDRGWPIALYNAQFEPYGVLDDAGNPLPALAKVQAAVVSV